MSGTAGAIAKVSLVLRGGAVVVGVFYKFAKGE